ncbi:MAG: hypothetical protein ACRES7_00225 [Gammaproteobacteria bacterium]
MATIYIGRDNPFKLQASEDGASIDLSGVTKMAVRVGAADTDSDANPILFDWSAGDGVVSIIVGLVPQLSAGAKRLRLIAYSDAWPDGIVLGDLPVDVTA